MIPVGLCVCVCARKEAVSSSRLYGLFLVRKDLHLSKRVYWSCDSGSSGVWCQEWEYMVAPRLGVCGVLSAHISAVHDIKNCMVLGESYGRSRGALRAFGVLSSKHPQVQQLGSREGGSGGWNQWFAHAQLWGWLQVHLQQQWLAADTLLVMRVAGGWLL